MGTEKTEGAAGKGGSSRPGNTDGSMSKKYFVYILECADGTLYTGFTDDLDKRLKAHNSGKGAKYTKNRLPVKLVYSEAFQDKKEAMSREWHIKHDLTREGKLRLIRS